MKTQDILREREKTHGDFEEVSVRYREIKRAVCRDFVKECIEEGDEEEYDRHFLALEMICLKLARIVCGDPNFADHWDDIAGYAMLGKGKVEESTEKKEGGSRYRCIRCNGLGGGVLNDSGRCYVCGIEAETVEKITTSSKMELPACEDCEDCERLGHVCAVCYQMDVYAGAPRKEHACTGEIAAEACRKKEEAEQECTPQDFRFFSYDEDFDDNMHQWWCLHCRKFFRWRNPNHKSFRESI